MYSTVDELFQYLNMPPLGDNRRTKIRLDTVQNRDQIKLELERLGYLVCETSLR